MPGSVAQHCREHRALPPAGALWSCHRPEHAAGIRRLSRGCEETKGGSKRAVLVVLLLGCPGERKRACFCLAVVPCWRSCGVWVPAGALQAHLHGSLASVPWAWCSDFPKTFAAAFSWCCRCCVSIIN